MLRVTIVLQKAAIVKFLLMKYRFMPLLDILYPQQPEMSDMEP